MLLKWGDHPKSDRLSTLSGDAGHQKRTRITERSIHHEREGRFAPQCLGVGAGLVRCIHDAQGLGWIDPWEERMHLDCETITFAIILNQTHRGADRGIID